jgi:hypothetical protein
MVFTPPSVVNLFRLSRQGLPLMISPLLKSLKLPWLQTGVSQWTKPMASSPLMGEDGGGGGHILFPFPLP